MSNPTQPNPRQPMAVLFHLDSRYSPPSCVHPPYSRPLSIYITRPFNSRWPRAMKFLSPNPLFQPLPCSLASLIFQKILPCCSQHRAHQTPNEVTYIVRLPEILLRHSAILLQHEPGRAEFEDGGPPLRPISSISKYTQKHFKKPTPNGSAASRFLFTIRHNSPADSDPEP
jgi:hypothetical protein